MMHLNLHVLTQHKKTLIIAAIASRCYVKAAVNAGFDVIAIDCFCDVDTQQWAQSVHQVALSNGCLDRKGVLKVIKSIVLDAVVGFCYGAGFEKQPELLNEINEYVEIIGNAGESVLHCKDPNRFFNTCDKLKVPHPEVTTIMPMMADGWLKKIVGASGGAHIRQLQENPFACLEDAYYQKYQIGKPISCLFLTNAQGVKIIGFSEQWVDGDALELYRYGGAVSYAKMSDLAKSRLTDYVEKLVQALALVGLNSCDAICNGDDVTVLEINPRLSATLELYAKQYPDLIGQHVMAFKNNSLDSLITDGSDPVCAAHQVIYAKNDLVITDNFSWPTWASDIPEPGHVFTKGMPVCTIMAEASTVKQAKSLVQSRVTALSKQFLN